MKGRGRNASKGTSHICWTKIVGDPPTSVIIDFGSVVVPEGDLRIETARCMNPSPCVGRTSPTTQPEKKAQAEAKHEVSATRETVVNQEAAANAHVTPDKETVAEQIVVNNQGIPQVDSAAVPVAESQEEHPEEDVDDMAPDVDEEPLTPEEEVMALRLRNTEFGTWFQFVDDTGTPRKAKLSWFSPLTKRYMFVDRNGVQVAVKPFKALVREMSEGTAKTIDPPGVSFFNLAMQSIKEMLERATGPVKTMSSRQ